MPMRYAIVIERSGRNFAAHVPDLPGCIATAATIAELESSIRAAIELHTAGMREDGIGVPVPTVLVDYVDVAA